MHSEVRRLNWSAGPEQLPLHLGQQPVQPEVLPHPLGLVGLPSRRGSSGTHLQGDKDPRARLFKVFIGFHKV